MNWNTRKEAPMKPFILSSLIFLSTSAFAADCITSFDNSCLSRQPTAEEVATDQEQTQQRIEQMRKEQAEVSAIEDEIEYAEREEQRKIDQEAREEERLNIESSQEDALWNISRSIRESQPSVNINIERR